MKISRRPKNSEINNLSNKIKKRQKLGDVMHPLSFWRLKNDYRIPILLLLPMLLGGLSLFLAVLFV